MIERARGFSLIELIAVIVLLGVLSVFVYPRFAGSDTASVQAGRDSLVAALFFAQQTAMARSSSTVTISAQIDANSVTVLENGSALAAPGQDNPTQLPAGVVVTNGTGEYTFDKLGRVDSPATITLGKGNTSATLTLEPTGYVHR